MIRLVRAEALRLKESDVVPTVRAAHVGPVRVPGVAKSDVDD
jgi:hypothetical protein